MTRHVRAWLLVAGALAIHVADEAMTGFLEFYNPLVTSIRTRFWWFPMPTFTFDVWLTGLIVLVLTLVLLTPYVGRGAPGTRIASWGVALIMLSNGIGHLAGSAYFDRWLPGATSSPLLFVASVLLIRAVLLRRRTPAEKAFRSF